MSQGKCVQIKKKASELSEEKVEEVRGENRKIIDGIVLQQNKAIAEAPGLSDEEAGRLKHEEILTTEQKNSLAAHRLAECYHVPPEVITPEFVKKYNKPKVMSTFSNLNHQVLSEESIADAVNKWRQLRAEKDNSIEDLSRGDNLLKCMFAVDILNGLMSSEDKEYCREFNRFHTRFIARVMLEEKINQIVADLQAHVETVSLVFGIRRDRLTAARKYLKAKLELVNTVINGAYGVKIVGVKEKGTAPNMFKLSEPKLFHWKESVGRYVVATEKTAQ
jgi:hypothetical protein